MSHKATDSEEEQLLPRPQQTIPRYQQSYPISQPPQYGQSSAQVPGTAFTGPYPNFANAGVPQYPPPYLHGSSNQMQQVVVVGQPQQPQVVIAAPAPRTYTWHIVLSCIVFWFCGWICGAIAFALAVHARSYSESGQLAGARRLGNMSVVVSVVGIVIGVAVMAVVIAHFTFEEKKIRPQQQ